MKKSAVVVVANLPRTCVCVWMTFRRARAARGRLAVDHSWVMGVVRHGYVGLGRDRGGGGGW